jgi:hypothetical protein
VDERLRRIRRLSGVNDPTPRVGVDGEWRPYQALAQTEIGLVILWPWINPNGTLPTTITSPVVAVTWNQPAEPAELGR